jgi:hypothetical protein
MNDVEPCAVCQRDHTPERPVTWSPAFDKYLCGNCRASKTDAELGATQRANLAATRKRTEGT